MIFFIKHSLSTIPPKNYYLHEHYAVTDIITTIVQNFLRMSKSRNFTKRFQCYYYNSDTDSSYITYPC